MGALRAEIHVSLGQEGMTVTAWADPPSANAFQPAHPYPGCSGIRIQEHVTASGIVDSEISLYLGWDRGDLATWLRQLADQVDQAVAAAKERERRSGTGA